MSNGVARAVLVHELIRCDGPHVAVADAFVEHRCMACGYEVADQPQFRQSGFYCSPCSGRV